MSTGEKPARRWWTKKRWLAVAAIWLAIGYLAVEGPAYYLVGRGWLRIMTVRAAFRPAHLTVGRTPVLADARSAYLDWWDDLGGGRPRSYHSTIGSPGWEIVLLSTEELENDVLDIRPDGSVFTIVMARVGGREIAVENARPTPGGGMALDGPVTLDGRPIAALPPGTKRLTMFHSDDGFEIEADGVPVDAAE